jgi:MYXO-CTERM domain-containing protein
MTRFLLLPALLLALVQRTATVPLSEALEMALVGVAVLGVAALLRRRRPAHLPITPPLFPEHTRRSLAPGPNTGR